MQRGLITTSGSGEYSIADQYQTGQPQTTAQQQGQAGLDASVTSTEGGPEAIGVVDSHLDSFFQQHALTREDVLVLAAVVQLAAWTALLYLEVAD